MEIIEYLNYGFLNERNRLKFMKRQKPRKLVFNKVAKEFVKVFN